MKITPHTDPLNAQQKLALRLREEEGLSQREIAARMGVSPERIRQVLAAARKLQRDCAAHGAEALCLLPERVQNFLEWNGLASRAALREAFESGRLQWSDSRKLLRLDGWKPRNLGWQSAQILHEWAGRPLPPGLAAMSREC
jgi:transcriptional regulator with XRE-family HTH domain